MLYCEDDIYANKFLPREIDVQINLLQRNTHPRLNMQLLLHYCIIVLLFYHILHKVNILENPCTDAIFFFL